MSGQSSGGKLVAMGDVTGTVSLLEVCESLAAPQANERKAIDLMFEREMKQEKNLEVREREIRRQKAAEAENKNKGNEPWEQHTLSRWPHTFLVWYTLFIHLINAFKTHNINNYSHTPYKPTLSNHIPTHPITQFIHVPYQHCIYDIHHTGDDNKKDAKDEKMEALLRKVDADFLAMIKEAEDDESKV